MSDVPFDCDEDCPGCKKRGEDMYDMAFHDAANLFPLMEGPQMEALAESIRSDGQGETIKTLGGQILDGRNRFLACKKAGRPPRFEALPDDTDPERYVAIHHFAPHQPGGGGGPAQRRRPDAAVCEVRHQRGRS
jgi:hypothetical protein